MTAIPTIRTDRLILRPPRREDFEAYAALLGDERSRYMGGPFGRAGAWDMFCNMVAGWHLSGHGGLLIDTEGDKTVGEVSIWHPDHFPEPELGWSLSARAEGKGYAFEAATALRAWYRRTTGAAHVVSYITPGNVRSEALAARLGATRDPDAPLPRGETSRETIVWRHDLAAATA